MGTFLFDSIIIGPIRSRRLGCSLGVNLLAPSAKLCNFDCIYCECGWNGGGEEKARGGDTKKGAFNPKEEVLERLENKLKQLAFEGRERAGGGGGEKGMPQDGLQNGPQNRPDVITFAGNGEPTMHPDFPEIIDSTLRLRDLYAPETKVAVLSNATMIDRESVREALRKVDRNILKLDSGIDETMKIINQPQNCKRGGIKEVIELLKGFNGDLIIQTLFLRGDYNGKHIDNTTEREVQAWIEAMREIRPKEVMIYTIDRDTPAKDLEKVPYEEMVAIGERLKKDFAMNGLGDILVSVAKN